MMAIFQTESGEALELISISLVAWIAIFGCLPAYLIIKLTKGINSNRRCRFIFIAVLVCIAILVKFSVLHGLLFALKQMKRDNQFLHPSYVFNKHLPYSYIYNSRIYLTRMIRHASQYKTDLTAQHTFMLKEKENQGTHFVLVVGESARADRFSLNGYRNNTTPNLSRINNLVSFDDCHALDTSTLKAVPHIFRYELQNKANKDIRETSLIHIFKHVGFKTFWFSCWQSQPSSVLYDIASEADLVAYATGLWTYNSGDTQILAYDHALLNPLKETIKTNKESFIVLHTKGSHASYKKRLPQNSQLYNVSYGRISEKSLSETYDDTIRYTDKFLSDVIDILKNEKAMLLYISDHGESLGENGVYAHSAPMEIAPKEQRHIPMMLWVSDKFLASPVNLAKFKSIKNNTHAYVDQSYVFHSALDCMGIQSNLINQHKSICRNLP